MSSRALRATAIALLLCGAACSKEGPAPGSPEARGIQLRDPDGHERVDKKFHVPLDQPTWVTGRDAKHMRPDDAVLGYLDGDLAWAIPWWIMDNHHAANLVLNGRPVVIALCERCGAGSAFDPVLDSVRHTFKVAGLWNGTIVTRDDQTGTLWAPFLGKAIWGPLDGRKLTRMRLDQGTWADWLELHPDTQVVLGTPDMREGHGARDFAPGQEILDDGMRRSLQHTDDRLPMFTVVLGVTVGEETRTYPIPELDRAGALLEDELGGQKIVILHKPGSWLAAAFSRTLGDRELHFEVRDGAIVDVATGTRFNVAGDAKSGELAGKRLAPVIYQLEEWYVWSAQHPGTTIHAART